jgi:hypothetical protein
MRMQDQQLLPMPLYKTKLKAQTKMDVFHWQLVAIGLDKVKLAARMHPS